MADGNAVAGALDELEAAYEKFAALSLDALTTPVLLTVLEHARSTATLGSS